MMADATDELCEQLVQRAAPYLAERHSGRGLRFAHPALTDKDRKTKFGVPIEEYFTPEYYRKTRQYYDDREVGKAAAVANRDYLRRYYATDTLDPWEFGRTETDPHFLEVRERLFYRGDDATRRRAREAWGRELMESTELGYGRQVDRHVDHVLGIPEYRYHGIKPAEKPSEQYDWLSRLGPEKPPHIAGPEPSRMAYLTPVAKALKLTDKDVLVDLGSGVGKASIFFGTVTPVGKVIGLEMESAYAHFAYGRAAALGLSHVHFLPQDLLRADLSEGTAFYFYNPFRSTEGNDLVGKLAAQLMALGDRNPIQIAVKGVMTDKSLQTHLQESGMFSAETVLEHPAVWTVFRS
ncbi:class I SAM-dependent methyltransferase [Nocardia sp. NPDC004568]|uniref:class I SAM-dependent methyltransferase n=1 Tax=Nocardia sp. NPDC004568 TaxID=3154551 RepID=UPI0033A7D043